MDHGGIDGNANGESSRDRVMRLADQGRMTHEAIAYAERLWHERLHLGVRLANGELAWLTLGDLYHCIVHERIWRKPERIERILAHIFEIRTAEQGRRRAMSWWGEDGTILVGATMRS